ncbi:uncharacterized protein LOC122242095 isoform X2 [Penaeus japonicus]|uniref:uncharacterized protein LOC122242095 isoform X2 n=1 Tax=Penaeus japonicus TaxID=27405 RepID=UPI001C715374|nr:uncharacterized protein LOC122242095 isoform X2 [Penaeus japonicus]
MAEPTSDENIMESDVSIVSQEELRGTNRYPKARVKRKRSYQGKLSSSQEEVAQVWKTARLCPVPGNREQVILTSTKNRTPDSCESARPSGIDSKPTEESTSSYALRARTDPKSWDHVVEDTFVYCHWCKMLYEGICPDHSPILVLNREVPRDGSLCDRARQTTPWPLRVAESQITGAGLGVFTDAHLPQGLVFGPYEGRIRTDSQESGYAWQVRSLAHKKKTIDSVDASISNWLRYVNCSRSDKEANLEAFQFLGNIYYLIIDHVKANSELLVWYGDKYGNELQSLQDAEGDLYADGASGSISKPNPGTIKKEEPAEVPKTTLSLSQYDMEPLFTPVVLKPSPDGSVQIQYAASKSLRRSPPGRSPRKVPQQYRKFDFTYCIVCKKTYRRICCKHPMPLLLDRPVPRNGCVRERARLTAPWPLVIRQSLIKGTAEGVVTTARLPKGLVLGPCEGWVLPRTKFTSGYSWEIDGRPDVEIDAEDTSFSNWTRYLKCPWTPHDQNLRPMQIRGEVFYVTTRDIDENSELLVWFGDNYGRWLTFPSLQLQSGYGNATARIIGNRGRTRKNGTRSHARKANHTPRRQDEKRRSDAAAKEGSEGLMKRPSKRRWENNPGGRNRKVVRVKCPLEYTDIEDICHKRHGIAFHSRSSSEGFPGALTGDAHFDEGLGDSRLKTLPRTKETRVQGEESRGKDPSADNVREIFPRRRQDACWEYSLTVGSHQSYFTGHRSLQDQTGGTEWTEDGRTSSDTEEVEAKRRHSSESNMTGDESNLHFYKPVRAQTPERHLRAELEHYSQSDSKVLLLPGTCARTCQYISSRHYRIVRLSDYASLAARNPIVGELDIYECSSCDTHFARKDSLIEHLLECSELFYNVRIP